MNLGLVKSYALGRFSWLEDKGFFTPDDLINEGVIGLIGGVERYDYRMNLKFSTYTTRWIIQAIDRAIKEKGAIIRLPVHVCEAVARIKRATTDLSLKLGREPSVEEIAQSVELPPEKVVSYLLADRSLISLETKVGEDEDTELGDLLPDKGPGTEEIAVQNLWQGEILGTLESLRAEGILTERELRVLQLRCGFFAGICYTLKETGQMLNPPITRERVRQIEAKALGKLRQPAVAKRLKEPGG